MQWQTTTRGLEATAGTKSCWTMRVPTRGKVNRVSVEQTGGGMAAFSIKIFNKEQACRVSLSSGGEDPDGEYLADPQQYQICEQVSSDSPGHLLHFFDSDQGNYVNMDAGPTSKKFALYIEMDIPAGSGACTFDVTLDGDQTPAA